jgi:hypothetical protein
VFKSKFEEKLSMIGANLENCEEFIQSDGNYLLIVPNFSLIEKYKDNFVCLSLKNRYLLKGY